MAVFYAPNNITREIAPKSWFEDATNVIDSALTCNQGDLLYLDTSTHTIKKVAAEANSATSLGSIDAMASARHSHHFIGIDQEGKTSVLGTAGNMDTHVILRGSRTSINYRKPEIVYAAELLKEAGFLPSVMVDCSHGNSDKEAERQEQVLLSLLETRRSGCRELMGFMMESNLFGGRQEIPTDLKRLRYGISITDPCLPWDKTEQLLLYAYEQLAQPG